MRTDLKEIYLPLKARVVEIVDMTADVKLFRVMPEDAFNYKPGQFIMVSLWGVGEVPISITSTYGIHEYVELCIKRVGHVTSAIHCLKSGDIIGIRGPFGNGFTIGKTKGKDILFIAGGIGIAPLRSLINGVLQTTPPFNSSLDKGIPPLNSPLNKGGRRGVLQLIYGSRNPSDVLFNDELNTWQKKGMHIILTVDKKDTAWKGNTGIVTKHLNKLRVTVKNAHAFVCGPHVMIDAVMRDLSSMGMHEDNIITTLEAHMKCGIGKCGHCYAGGKYICTDGPVFSYGEIKRYNLKWP
ncbi:MAG: FAD/NAD(P)-binding protein [Nitrospirae bacterium]|nr:FAD/NAD(P)-binding protein [Nitrospirota bacterium]